MTDKAKWFVRFHEADNFSAHLTKNLELRMGLAENTKLLGWDSETQWPTGSDQARAA
jgi:Zn-dependent M32 family carboxypeptidase